MIALAAGLLLVPVLDQAPSSWSCARLAPASLPLGPSGKLQVVRSRIWYARVPPGSGRRSGASWFFAAASLAVLTGFFPLSGWFAGALLGGSLSHALETSLRGYIIDYVRLRFWPAFNLADVAITVGAVGILVQMVITTTEAWCTSPSLAHGGSRSPASRATSKSGGHWVSAYKVCLCIGIYAGTLVSAAVAQGSGISPLRMGVGCVSCAIVGMVGARIFYLMVFARLYANERFWAEVWNPKTRRLVCVWRSDHRALFLSCWPTGCDIPVAVYWDHMIFGIVAGAVWIRFGCICNGCCGGKQTTKWYGMEPTRYPRYRVCAEFRCNGSKLAGGSLAGAGLLGLWTHSFPPGSCALGVLCWYGLGRFWLEPLREQQDLVAGRLRINQLVAALLALVAGGALLLVVS